MGAKSCEVVGLDNCHKKPDTSVKSLIFFVCDIQEKKTNFAVWIPVEHHIWSLGIQICARCTQQGLLNSLSLLVKFGFELCFVAISYYSGVIMSAMASQITSLTIVYSTVYSGGDQRTHQSSASLAFVRGIHRWPVNSPHKRPVTRKMFAFDDVIML